MPIRAKPLIVIATLAATCALSAVMLPKTKAAARAAPSFEQLSDTARTSLVICREHAAMAHDVAWAAACIAHARGHGARRAECVRQRGDKAQAECDMLLGPEDDSPDCSLPNDQAGRLNTMLSTAENSCMEQAVAENGLMRANGLGPLRRSVSAQ